MWRVQYWGPTSKMWISQETYSTREKAQVEMVKSVFEDPRWAYRIYEIKENTNDQDQ